MALTVSFENIGETPEVPVASLLTINNPAGAASASLPGNDQIWRWDTANSTWIKYYYRKVGTQAAIGWCAAGATTVTTDTIPCGETFFFRRGTAGGSATTLTLSGAVKQFTASASYSVEPGKYCFMGYPWPIAMSIADFTKYQGAPAGAASASLPGNDQIWLWDTETSDWVKYYYRKVGTQPAVGWCKAGATTVTTDTIPAGEGFFFRRGTAGTTDTITFSYPTTTTSEE